jgi:hypothetical protein
MWRCWRFVIFLCLFRWLPIFLENRDCLPIPLRMKPVFKGSKQKEWQYKIVQDSWYHNRGKPIAFPGWLPSSRSTTGSRTRHLDCGELGLWSTIDSHHTSNRPLEPVCCRQLARQWLLHVHHLLFMKCNICMASFELVKVIGILFMKL